MQQQLILPEGGLASFLTSNIDELDDSQLAFGRQSGINSHTDVAERMAALGRNGDTELVHAEKGEIVIHPKLLAENPRLAKEMMDAFTNSDVDLSRYIIGSRSNSINPDTGQAEFFLKKLGRGLKKLVGGIKKIVKKFAPIVVPALVGLFTGGWGLGLMGQGALAGGITSLVQGGNFKDAMKGALIGGVIGGVTAGAKGAYKSSSGNRFKGFGKGFMQSAPKSFGGGGLKFGEITGISANNLDGTPVDFTSGGTTTYQTTPEVIAADATAASATIDSNLLIEPTPTLDDPSFLDKTLGLLKKKPLTLEQAKANLVEGGKYINVSPEKLTNAAQVLVDASKANPDFSPYKLAGAALAGGAAFGAFDPIPAVKPDDPYPKSSKELLEENPHLYSVGSGVPQQGVTMDQTMIDPIYEKYLSPYLPATRAAGGEMGEFPRRTGYISGPGTETSDSIPAMLSDGEFVMNAKAVRGAGNGSRKAGVRNMYDMMRAFEGGAVA